VSPLLVFRGLLKKQTKLLWTAQKSIFSFNKVGFVEGFGWVFVGFGIGFFVCCFFVCLVKFFYYLKEKAMNLHPTSCKQKWVYPGQRGPGATCESPKQNGRSSRGIPLCAGQALGGVVSKDALSEGRSSASIIDQLGHTSLHGCLSDGVERQRHWERGPNPKLVPADPQDGIAWTEWRNKGQGSFLNWCPFFRGLRALRSLSERQRKHLSQCLKERRCWSGQLQDTTAKPSPD